MVNPVTELRKRLAEENLSQAALAAKLGISEPAMSMVIRGARPPNRQILRFLGLERIVRVTYRRLGTTGG